MFLHCSTGLKRHTASGIVSKLPTNFHSLTHCSTITPCFCLSSVQCFWPKWSATSRDLVVRTGLGDVLIGKTLVSKRARAWSCKWTLWSLRKDSVCGNIREKHRLELTKGIVWIFLSAWHKGRHAETRETCTPDPSQWFPTRYCSVAPVTRVNIKSLRSL